MRSFHIFALAAVLLATASERASAQANDYPNRAVTFVVPFAPGGVTGLFARLLGQKLEQRLGKPFVVDHRPGGGGITAATAVARAAPDGYTIMMASSTILAFNVTVRKELAYDPRKDLTPIALLGAGAVRAGGQPGAAGEVGRGSREAREGKAGPAFVRLAGAGHVPPSQRGNLQEPVRRRSGSCTVQRHRARAAGYHRGPRLHDVRRRAARARPDRVRKNPCARRHHGAARGGAAGHSAARRSRHAGLRRIVLAHHNDHGRCAQGDRRPSSPGKSAPSWRSARCRTC